ncbi:MAG: Acidobacterial duplicated orphan permease (function unknown) [uncultured Chthoniobacterales bacterium]|uniref:ABC transporter permease n=1 Tax=uncultured Chthoniobacterales bacterium TaxID=1836801 RepID=A0A6J4H955_9BACT|nr:MAG: Acidobacterial duplicated orphan permease (function unknown) [uncultured Chthoniobacterales bacterium]
MNDLRFALRQLRKSPGFTLVAVLTLALGIGANTAIFSVIHAVLLRPLPYPEPHRIMALHEANGAQEFSLAFPDYMDWRRDNTVFEHLALSRRDSRNLTIPGREPERIGVSFVTANFFNVIGLPAQLGRTFTEEEDRVGGPALMVISDRLWQRLFNRDPNMLGRSITFHNQPVTVVGVMPPAMSSPQETDAWFPIMRRTSNPAWQNRANHPMMFAWGRLKPGVTVEQARAEMKTIAARLEQQYPDTNAGVTAVVKPLLDNLVGGYRKNLTLLLGSVGLVLLIACANLANLFAARGAARAREFAIRAAVGASRAQIVRQLLIESTLIALLGGALGYLFAVWSGDAIAALGPSGVTRFQEVSFDLRVLGFTFALAALTSVLFGLWPALGASRANVQLALKSGSAQTSDTRSARRSRDWLVIGEIALTVVLLSSAALVMKSFARAQALSLGYEPRDLLTARVDLPSSNYRSLEAVQTFSNGLLDRVRALPGVSSASIGTNPVQLSGWQSNFQREGQQLTTAEQPNAESEVVAPDYFATLKAPIIRGRALDERDKKGAPLAVVIDETLAQQIFPGEDPLGKRLSSAPGDGEGAEERLYEIVGIVGRMQFRGFDDPTPLPALFFSQGQVERTNLVLLVRSTVGKASLEKSIRDVVASIDPNQPVHDVRPMMERVAETWAAPRLMTWLLAVFAGLALVLATIGLYGVISYTVLRRMREIGLRLALGAQRGHIRALIAGQGARLLGLGLVLGTLGALASSRLLKSFLFDIEAVDLSVYFAVSLLLALAAAAACWLPTRSASRVDPIITLRAE